MLNIKQEDRLILEKYQNIFPIQVGAICADFNIEVKFVSLNGQSGKLDGNIIYVNDDYSATRNRFTIAHEIGHFLFNRDKNCNKNRFDDKTQHNDNDLEEEMQANFFAADLLMPKLQFKENFYKFEKNLTLLANFFGVSRW